MPDQRPAVQSITEKDIQDGKMMAVLAYIIFFIPIIAARDKKFAMFHAEQGIVLFIVSVIISIVVNILVSITGVGLISILNLITFILWILGIINSAGGKVKELPVVGAYGAKFNLVK